MNEQTSISDSALPIIKYSELCAMDLPEVNYLVEGLIPEIGITMFQGHPGTYKTWFAYYVGYCIANGAPLLGSYITKKTKVLLICPDDYLVSTRDRLIKAGFAQDIEVSVWNPKERIDVMDEHFEQLCGYIESEQFGAVVIDTLKNIHHADENDSEQMGTIMQRLQGLAEKRSVIILHHLNKSAVSAHVVASRGSTVIPASLISGFNFRRSKEGSISVNQFKNKIGVLTQELHLKFDPSNKGTELFTMDKAAPMDDVIDIISEAVMEFYSENADPELTKNEIAGMLHERTNGQYSKSAIDKALGRLIKEGRLRWDGIKRPANRRCFIQNPDYAQTNDCSTG